MTTQKYNAASRQLLAQARAELVRGDILQASEKGWGAAAQIVKAMAEDRGWPHRHHGLLTQAIEALTAETNDDELADRFAIANSVHVNFYEDALSSRTVRRHLDQIEDLADAPESMLPRGTASTS